MADRTPEQLMAIILRQIAEHLELLTPSDNYYTDERLRKIHENVSLLTKMLFAPKVTIDWQRAEEEEESPGQESPGQR